MISLHPYQQAAHDQLVSVLVKHPSALDASDTGTGKSYVAAMVAKTLGLKPCVICPKAVVPMWKSLLEEAGVAHWAVGTWEMMRAKTLPHGRDLFILDECQKAKGRDTLNAKLALTCAAAGKVLCLSATAASNPLEMKALGAILQLYPRGGYWNWVHEHGCKKGFFGGLVYKGGVEGMTRIHSKIFPHRGVRLRIEDLPSFPECDTQVDVLDFGEPVEELQLELDALAQAALEDKDPDNPLTMLTRARQRTELLKVPGLVETIEEWVEAGRSVALFANYNETLVAIKKRLKTRSEFYTGEVADKLREQRREDFQRDNLRVLLINIKAGGTGLSLHDLHGNFPRVSLICPSFSVQDYRQALGRIHRSGAKSKALQKILFAAGTVEERVAKLLRAKEMNLDALNDADLLGEPSPILVDTLRKTTIDNPPLLVETPPQKEPIMNLVETKTENPVANIKVSPSGLKYVRLSPCFQNDQTGDKTAADEGTLLHSACETGVIPDTFSEEQKQAVRMCLDYAAPLVATKGSQVFRELVFDELTDLSPIMRRGKADLVVLHANHTADLLDWKMGRNSVDEAEHNDQQKAYVIAMFKRWPELRAVQVHLVQPRRDEISRHIFLRSDEPRLKTELAATLFRVEQAHRNNRLMPRTDTCLWCAKRHTCPVVVNTAVTVAKGYDAELKIPEEFHPSKVTDPQAMAAILDTAAVMDKWVQSARHHFTQAALNGTDIPGYELREKKGIRSISDPVAAYQVARERVSPDDFIQACDISLPKLETLWCATAPRGKKGHAKAELSEKLTEADALTSGAPSHFLGRIRK